MLDPSWTHEKRHLMHFLYMGIMENADPHPSDTFEVTLRGEKLSRHWTRRIGAIKGQGQVQTDAMNRYIKLLLRDAKNACLLEWLEVAIWMRWWHAHRGVLWWRWGWSVRSASRTRIVLRTAPGETDT